MPWHIFRMRQAAIKDIDIARAGSFRQRFPSGHVLADVSNLCYVVSTAQAEFKRFCMFCMKANPNTTSRKAQMRHVEQMLTSLVERFLNICVAGSTGSFQLPVQLELWNSAFRNEVGKLQHLFRLVSVCPSGCSKALRFISYVYVTVCYSMFIYLHSSFLLGRHCPVDFSLFIVFWHWHPKSFDFWSRGSTGRLYGELRKQRLRRTWSCWLQRTLCLKTFKADAQTLKSVIFDFSVLRLAATGGKW